MAHDKTGGRGGNHREMADNFASLVFGDSRKAPEDVHVFSRTTSKIFVYRLLAGSHQSIRNRW